MNVSRPLALVALLLLPPLPVDAQETEVPLAARLSTDPAARPLPTSAAGDTVDSAVVFAVADEYFAAYTARTNTVDHFDATHDALPDNSLQGLRRWQAREDEWLARLDSVDPDSLWGSPAWVLHASLRERLASNVQMRVCHRPLWRVDPDFGWHIDPGFPALGRTQPVGTLKARSAALKRWSAFGRFVDTEIENLREGLRQGYAAPRPLVELVIEQVGRLAGQNPEESPFYDPARRDSDPEFRAAFRGVIEQNVQPALRRYRDFLAEEYLPRSRPEAGLSAVPWGLDCYRAFLRAMTTLPLDETQVDSIGRTLLARAVAERDRIAHEYYGLADGRTLSEAVAADSSLRWSSHAEAFEAAQGAVARATDLLPRHFLRIPPITVPVVDTMTTEEGRNVGFGAFYRSASWDGTEPARVVVNPFVFGRPGSRGTLFRLMYHEGVPGHHLQAAFEESAGRTHPYLGLKDRFDGQSLPAYSEGWARYAEDVLAEEMGIASEWDPITSADAPVNDALWFLFTDGVQMRGWSVEEAIDTVRAYVAGLNDDGLEWAYASAAITPGYWLAYTLGSLEIQRLRRFAERELGPDFDVREFHDQVLMHGEIPLPALREAIERWVRDARNEPATRGGTE